MSNTCHSHGRGCAAPPTPTGNSSHYRRVLQIALFINAAMFGVELWSGWHAGSVSLLADAVDFLGDAANYGVSLWVLGRSARMRANAALLKGISMGAFGVFVLAQRWG